LSTVNYLKIDNKPVVFVFAQSRLSGVFPNPADQKDMFDACREYAKSVGFSGMTFAVCDNSPSTAVHADLMARGYDFRFGYDAGYRSPCDFYADEGDIIAKQCERLEANLAVDPMHFVATASCFCDPTPRFSERWNSLGYAFRKWMNIWYLQPENYRILLERMKAISDATPEGSWARRMIMIDNWNEWDEGHFVAPSHRFGFRYLQAIREELTERDNLPDYRTPRDVGITDLNTSWEIPDMAEISKKKLAEKDSL
jgi:hypothetical protein